MKYLKLFLFLSSLFLVTPSFSQKNLKLKKYNLKLTSYENDFKLYYNVKEYDYYFKSIESNIEIRIIIKPNKKQDALEFEQKFIDVLSNLVDKTYEINLKYLPNNTLEKEYNAEYGMLATFKPNLNFGNQFDFASLICIGKLNNCDIYILSLINKDNLDLDIIKKYAYVITFEE